MKKKISVIFIFLAFILTMGCFTGFKINTQHKVYAVDTIQSKSAYLIEPSSKTVIYSKNENERLPIASMCKIMTLLLSFEAIDQGIIKYDDLVCISKNASSMGGSQVFLEENGKYCVGELIKSITVASANDACVAMAETICGSEENFVEKMNIKAKELQMDDTLFCNCTGLPAPEQYSSAKDVATMFSELIKHDDYFRFSRIWTDKVAHPNDRYTEITNTNKLVKFYQGCDGGKTGYTSEAGHCLSSTACRKDMRFICVVICAPDSKTRFKEVSNMFNYAFDNYTNKLIVDNEQPLDIKVDVKCGKKQNLSVIPEKPFYLLSKKNNERQIEIDFNPTEKIKAPVNKGDVVGKLSIYEKGELLNEINVLANETIKSQTYFDVIRNICNNWSLTNI